MRNIAFGLGAIGVVAWMGMAGCGKTGEQGVTCVSSVDCAGEAPGQVCVAGKCAPCDSDTVCQEDPAYGETCTAGKCESCVAEGCACPSKVCDETEGIRCDVSKSKCVVAVTCESITDCVANQACEPHTATDDATCLEECVPGWEWNAASGACDQRPSNCIDGDPASILASCQDQFRLCSEEGAFANCTVCLDGYFDKNGACVEIPDCEALGCDQLNRNCQTDPFFKCTECKNGFTEADTGACRPVITCDDLNCQSIGAVCSAGDGTTDAVCKETCGTGEVPVLTGEGSETGVCAFCSCDGPGEGDWEPVASQKGNCVCKTEPGYYFDESNFLQAQPCDADNDGWLRHSARAAINSTDPLIRQNARCTLAEVEVVVLENDPGAHSDVQSYQESLTEPVPLYENDILDAAEKLIVNGDDLVAYQGGVRLKPEHLNGLTKYCTDSIVDYNMDGQTDLTQHQAMAGGPADEAFAYKYSYFAEIYQGWFEQRGDAVTLPGSGTTKRLGSYHIREKQRPFDLPEKTHYYPSDQARGLSIGHMPLKLSEPPTEDGSSPEYWRQCMRGIHPAYDLVQAEPVGYDFAMYPRTGPEFFGMGHNSQFRCVKLTKTISVAELYDGRNDAPYTWNSCTLSPDPESNTPALYGANALSESAATPGMTNPRQPVMTCEPNLGAAALPEDTIGWVVMRYRDGAGPYQADTWTRVGEQYGTYQGGCLNECVHQNLMPTSYQCPGYPGPGTACDDRDDNFGVRHCGCGLTFGGSQCDRPCTPNSLHYHSAFYIGMDRLEMGHWACTNIVGNPTKPIVQFPSDPDLGFSIRGAHVVSEGWDNPPLNFSDYGTQVDANDPICTADPTAGGPKTLELCKVRPALITAQCYDQDPGNECWEIRR